MIFNLVNITTNYFFKINLDLIIFLIHCDFIIYYNKE